MRAELSSGTPADAEPNALAAKNGRSRSTRLSLGSYFADIVPDQNSEPSVIYWIVQRTGSPEVLSMDQEATLAHALEQAHACLQVLVTQKKSRKKHRAIFYEFSDAKKAR